MKQLVFYVSILLLACQSNKDHTKKTEETDLTDQTDPHSYSQPKKAITKHLDLDLSVDFATQTLSGKAVWTIENIDQTDTIIFDTRQLQIEKVTLDSNKKAEFSLGKNDKYLGRPLSIKIEPETKKVSIWYKTSKDLPHYNGLHLSKQPAKNFHSFTHNHKLYLPAHGYHVRTVLESGSIT